MAEEYEAFIDDQRADPTALMFHYQEPPFPGGMHYRIHIRNPEAVESLQRKFPVGVYGHLGREDASYVLGFVNLNISLKWAKAKLASEISFWINDIRRMEVVVGEVTLSGECSTHKEANSRS